MLTGFILLGVFAYIIIAIATGILSLKLHDKKGYDGGFFMGLFLGIIGLIYSAGLPDRRARKAVHHIKRSINYESEYADEADEDLDDEVYEENDEEGIDYILCKQCGYPIYKDEKICANCGAEIKEKDVN